MEVNRNLSKAYRELSLLNIGKKEKKDLIKHCYNCAGKLMLFPLRLNHSIEEVTEKNLKGIEAYEFIMNKISNNNLQKERNIDHNYYMWRELTRMNGIDAIDDYY